MWNMDSHIVGAKSDPGNYGKRHSRSGVFVSAERSGVPCARHAVCIGGLSRERERMDETQERG